MSFNRRSFLIGCFTGAVGAAAGFVGVGYWLSRHFEPVEDVETIDSIVEGLEQETLVEGKKVAGTWLDSYVGDARFKLIAENKFLSGVLKAWKRESSIGTSCLSIVKREEDELHYDLSFSVMLDEKIQSLGSAFSGEIPRETVLSTDAVAREKDGGVVILPEVYTAVVNYVGGRVENFRYVFDFDALNVSKTYLETVSGRELSREEVVLDLRPDSREPLTLLAIGFDSCFLRDMAAEVVRKNSLVERRIASIYTALSNESRDFLLQFSPRPAELIWNFEGLAPEIKKLRTLVGYDRETKTLYIKRDNLRFRHGNLDLLLKRIN